MKSIHPILTAATLACIAIAPSADGLFTGSAWQRPASLTEASTDGTTFQHWDLFTSVQHNAPDVANINPNGIADAFDSNPNSGAFITGNIYSHSGVIHPRAVVPGYSVPGATVQVLAQVASWGDLIDTAAVTVNGMPASSLAGYGYSQLASYPDPQGAIIYHAWRFDLPAAAMLQIDWGWGVTSSSFTELLIDTRVIESDSHFPGDATLDGKVDTLDFNLLAANFGMLSGAGWAQGDFTGDSAVTSQDFNVLTAHYGEHAPAGAAVAGMVPEPVCIAFAPAAILFAGRRKR